MESDCSKAAEPHGCPYHDGAHKMSQESETTPSLKSFQCCSSTKSTSYKSVSAKDLYEDIKSTREDELQKIIQEQKKTIRDLEEKVRMYQKTIEDLNTEERSAKKRKRDDENYDNTEQHLKKQVEELTEKLTRQDNELQ